MEFRPLYGWMALCLFGWSAYVLASGRLKLQQVGLTGLAVAVIILLDMLIR